jgi:hypothetical protein
MLLFISGVFFSCDKNDDSGQPGATFVKVIEENHVYNPGKIRVDAYNNLFCSYSYTDYDNDSSSAIVKLDSLGNVIGQQDFPGLAIYDFQLNDAGEPMTACFEQGIVSITKLSASLDEEPQHTGSFALPLDVTKIRKLNGLKMLKKSDGDYLLYGVVRYAKNPFNGWIFLFAGFDDGGSFEWGDTMYLSDQNHVSGVTGCAESGDGYVFLGYTQFQGFPVSSEFFVMKTDLNGVVQCETRYTTSLYNSIDSTYSGYYCETSDLIPALDGQSFYGCAFNVRFNIPYFAGQVNTSDDNSARIFRFDACGNVLARDSVNVDEQNQVTDLLLTKNGDFLLGINPYPLFGVYYVGQQNAYSTMLNSQLDFQSAENLQTKYMDYVSSMCNLSEGTVAIETIIQSFGGDGYRLQITKTDKNGNF